MSCLKTHELLPSVRHRIEQRPRLRKDRHRHEPGQRKVRHCEGCWCVPPHLRSLRRPLTHYHTNRRLPRMQEPQLARPLDGRVQRHRGPGSRCHRVGSHPSTPLAALLTLVFDQHHLGLRFVDPLYTRPTCPTPSPSLMYAARPPSFSSTPRHFDRDFTPLSGPTREPLPTTVIACCFTYHSFTINPSCQRHPVRREGAGASTAQARLHRWSRSPCDPSERANSMTYPFRPAGDRVRKRKRPRLPSDSHQPFQIGRAHV